MIPDTTYKNFAAAIHALCYEWERIPVPELMPNADGGYTYDWYLSPYRTLSVSTADGKLYWAWLDDERHGHGSAADDGFPAEIQTVLKLLYETPR